MGFEWADFDRALAGVIGGLVAGITKVDRERTNHHASTSGSRLDESTPCESELFGVGEGALN